MLQQEARHFVVGLESGLVELRSVVKVACRRRIVRHDVGECVHFGLRCARLVKGGDDGRTKGVCVDGSPNEALSGGIGVCAKVGAWCLAIAFKIHIVVRLLLLKEHTRTNDAKIDIVRRRQLSGQGKGRRFAVLDIAASMRTRYLPSEALFSNDVPIWSCLSTCERGARPKQRVAVTR